MKQLQVRRNISFWRNSDLCTIRLGSVQYIILETAIRQGLPISTMKLLELVIAKANRSYNAVYACMMRLDHRKIITIDNTDVVSVNLTWKDYGEDTE